jgi:transcriptional regulator with XRE-family HTH domain
MNLGEKIKKIRDLKGIKQEELARCLNITPQAYSKIERNETKLDMERLEQIAKILEVSVEDIKQFDERNVFVNSLRECENSSQSTGNTVNNYYYGHEAVPKLEVTIQTLEKIIDQQKSEIDFLRKQIEKLIGPKNSI